MKYIPKTVSRKAALTIFKTKQFSPQILFVGGVIGVIGTTVLACNATLKVEAILEDAEKDKADAGRLLNMKDQPQKYDADDHDQDIKYIKVRTTVKIAKLYAPSLALGALSIAALAGSHNILTKRNAALTAAYATLEKAYSSYRRAVIEEFGEEKDRELRFGKIEETVLVEGTNGPKKEKKSRFEHEHLYSRWFGPENKNWTHVHESNVYFLQGAQNYCNDRLNSEGFLLLNDVFEYLGFPRTAEGCVTGWVRDTKEGKGDGFVDFGIFNKADRGRLHDYAIGLDDRIMLDFNSEGTVLEMIKS